MLAYRIDEANRPLIKANNDNVTPEVNDVEEHYFITATGGDNRVVTKTEFEADYKIIVRLNEAMGRYTVVEK